MCKVKYILIMALVAFFSQSLFAKNIFVPYNNTISLYFEEGDEIVLENTPYDWGFSRVVFGVGAVSGSVLSGQFVVNGCIHKLKDYYEQIDANYSGPVSITYRGPSQVMSVHWWVGESLLPSSCETEEIVSRKDSILHYMLFFLDSVYNERVSQYTDLGTLNNSIRFEGSSGLFKITTLPEWFFNRIHVKVDPLDGRELNGYLYAGNKRTKVDGWSSEVALSQVSLRTPKFEIAFPEYRKVRITWWVSIDQPKEDEIPVQIETVGVDSVYVQYDFGRTPYTLGKIKLKFERNDFVDGNIPVIKKITFNAKGLAGIDSLKIMGNVYDIRANLKGDKPITVALPLDFEYVAGRDTVFMGHYIESERRWVKEPVDSIVNNVVFFRAKSFSLWAPLQDLLEYFNEFREAVYCPSCAFYAMFDDDFAHEMEDVASRWASVQIALLDGSAIDYVYDFISNLRCFNYEDLWEQMKSLGNGLKNLFGGTSTKELDIPQGILSPRIKNDSALVNFLIRKSQEGFIRTAFVLEDVCHSMSATLLATTGQATDCSVEEKESWTATRTNLDILLANEILSRIDLHVLRRYILGVDDSGNLTITDKRMQETIDFSDIFKTNGGLLKDAAEVVSRLRACYEMSDMNGLILDGWLNVAGDIGSVNFSKACSDFYTIIGVKDVVDYVGDNVSCASFLLNVGAAVELLGGHANKLLLMSDIMVRVSLLSWINKTMFRKYAAVTYRSVYDGTRAWLELVAPMMLYNNVVIKAYASLALYEYINYGTMDNFSLMNRGLDLHYGTNGGFSEGSGYSQFIWDDVSYILASLKQAYWSKEQKHLDINWKFLKSPDYMFEFSRPVKDFGIIPIEIDDGCTYNPDYRVWAMLKDDPKYLAWAEQAPLKATDGKINVLAPFGVPDEFLYSLAPAMTPNKASLWGDYKDGLAFITAVGENGDMVTLSMIAESGVLLKNGQSHDQQDNLSITLSSKNKGFVIQDRGYSGFVNRGDDDIFHKYKYHNVLIFGRECDDGINSLCPQNSQPDNHQIDATEMRNRLEDFSGHATGLWWYAMSYVIDFLNIGGAFFAVEGGYKAVMIDSYNKSTEKVVGYTARTYLDKTVLPVATTRTILYFGGSFWVIDQPPKKGMVWLANSPIDNWSETTLDLYGSGVNPIESINGVNENVQQEGSRMDYYTAVVNGEEKKYLPNYWYAFRDGDADTYVMKYTVDDEGFEKTDKKCPANFQCFRNKKDNKRLIVPPENEKYRVASVLGNRFRGYPETDGIMLATLAKDKVWEYHVLNGKTYGDYENKYLAGMYKLLLLSR